MDILDTRPNLNAMVLKHEQQIKDLAAHLLELKQLVTPMMEFKQPTKIFGPNLEETLNAAGFYRKKDWVGLMRGVRVEGNAVVITVKGGNDEARALCGELINEMEKNK